MIKDSSPGFSLGPTKDAITTWKLCLKLWKKSFLWDPTAHLWSCYHTVGDLYSLRDYYRLVLQLFVWQSESLTNVKIEKKHERFKTTCTVCPSLLHTTSALIIMGTIYMDYSTIALPSVRITSMSYQGVRDRAILLPCNVNHNLKIQVWRLLTSCELPLSVGIGEGAVLWTGCWLVESAGRAPGVQRRARGDWSCLSELPCAALESTNMQSTLLPLNTMLGIQQHVRHTGFCAKV